MSLNVCIFGVSGYTGSKLLHILDKHKEINIQGVFGSKSLNKKLGDLYCNLHTCNKVVISNYKDFNYSKTDLIFSCLPHGMLQNEIIKEIDSDIPLIDLSGDFRLDSIEEYESFYKCEHKAKTLQKKFIYGLSEVYKKKIKNNKFISNPGCYPTSILIPIIPLINEKIFNVKDVIVDSKSGISGAGKQANVQNLFAEISENFFSYGLSEHKHYPEIMQELKKIESKISFTFIPHVLPIISGIQSTIYINKTHDTENYLEVMKKFYRDDPFIKIYSGSKIPSIKDVVGTNNVAINIFTDYSKKRIVIVSCIDNLVKGASGQAVQNMNLMFDFKETEALI